ncbi:MAG TPA: ABC transporter ATP-binding protein [Candidatus Acidoferrum sp.]|nr:ABC transporter ATP-binding protein [Candidatus Acidoferrum sp.]
MENILEVNSIFKKYNAFSLEDIRFHLPKGYIMGLVGPNGAGKTTIIKSVVNAINVDSGTVKVFGLDAKADEIKIKERLGYISDEIYFSDTWSAKDINTIMKRLYSSWDSRAFTRYVRRYDLPMDGQIHTYSSGMKTKLMLSAVFSRDTRLLVLDEPTSGLDPVMRDEFLTLIKEYIGDGERSVLYSTHITTDLEKTADYLTFVNDGRLVFSEETDALRETYYLIKDSLDVLDRIKNLCIGLRTNAYGFDALTTRDNLIKLPDTCVRQPASIDEIVVFFSLKGEGPQ